MTANAPPAQADPPPGAGLARAASRAADKHPATHLSAQPGPGAGRRRRRGVIAIAGLALVVGIFLVLDPGRYLSFNSALGRLSPAEHPEYFPILVVHVFGGSIATIAVVLQVWPWLRRRHPLVHRQVGRVYVATAWPVGLAAIFTSVVWPFSPVSSVSDITHALLWLTATTYGFALARQHRWADHRRWMLRSFILCVSIIINRIVTVPLEMITSYLSTRVTPVASNIASVHPIVPGSPAWFLDVSAIDSWLGWTIALIAMEWWLDRDRRRRPAPAERIPPSVPAKVSR